MHRLAVLALYGVAAVGTFVVLSLIGVTVDGPARAISRYVAGYGVGASFALIAVLLGGAILFTRWAIRRIERQRLTQGVLDMPQQRDTRPPRPIVRWVMAPLWLAVAVLFAICVVVAIRDLA